METTNPVHVFERANLGRAPFRCVGVSESVYQACQGAPIQPGSSCDYCGTGIRWVYTIQGADGRTFKVGSDCVAKTGDAGLKRAVKSHESVRRAQARAEKKAVLRASREATWRREGAEKARAFLAEHADLRAALTARHPILRDMAQRLVRWGSLSEKQVAFALRLADEARAPKVAEPVLVEVPAVEGRQVLRGRVLTVKAVQGFARGTVDFKVLLLVDAGEGRAFKLWGTCPSAILDRAERGVTVELTAGVARSDRDPFFGYLVRPAKARVVEGA